MMRPHILVFSVTADDFAASGAHGEAALDPWLRAQTERPCL
jgi:hypothetical protein